MSATDWSHMESSGLSMLHTGNAPDLFGGDLFGDELMDMYNSDAVVVGNGDDSGEIHTLLLSVGASEHMFNKTNPDACDQTTMIAAVMDDGLGAFRPSTSFNDFSSLLTSIPAVVESSVAVTSAPKASQAPKQEVGRKRSVGECIKPGPAAMKRANTGKPSSPGPNATAVTCKPSNAICGAVKVGPLPLSGQTSVKVRKEQQAISSNRNSKANTPNPLSSTVATAPFVPQKPSPRTLGSGIHSCTPELATCVIASATKGDSVHSDTVVAAVAAAATVNEAPYRVSSSSVATEADFTSIAQAAVSSLILNAGVNPNCEGLLRLDLSKKGVDLSTAHIKALTSTNWVTACSGSDADLDLSADAKANRARRQNLNPDERARQNRDRNREHARNTRLRKKAYVEELKRTLTELVSQRDSAEAEKKVSAQRELEQREVRFRVMEEFLKLRGRNELNVARWIAILEEGFSLSLPFTTFREMSESKSNSARATSNAVEQMLRGTAEVMEDARSMSTFLQTLGNDNNTGTSMTPVTLMYHCDRKNFFMDDCAGFLVWSATSIGAVVNGAPYELSLKGNMRANFSPASNKLMSAEIQFDTGTVVDQLQDLIVARSYNDQMDSDFICDGIAAAAQAAANEADALLDSLQMPHLGGSIPAAITVAPDTARSAAVSVTSFYDKSDSSSDESLEYGKDHAGANSSVSMRRSVRRLE